MLQSGPAPEARPAPSLSPGRLRLAAGLIVLAGVLAYANTLTAPFVFDDYNAILANPSIRRWSTAFQPPPEAGGAASRPLVNLTLALNYAAGGLRVEGYHVFNLLVHVAAGLLLFGLVRRTLGLPRLRAQWGTVAPDVAFFTALLWTVHPLNTESVTCIIQRTESLLGLWLLLMFYCLARAADSPAPRRWLAGSWAACLLGMFTKEVMVVAPLLALLFQALAVDGSWRTAWARRGRYFAALALCWLPLALLVAGNATRAGTAGFGQGVAWWEYALTQAHAITLYLRLTFWPHPLVLDYGEVLIRTPSAVLPQLLLLAALLSLTLAGLVRRHPAALAGAWFFLILAPSSSVVPLVTQTIAEHRMYLPLAAVLTLVVATVHRWLPRGRAFLLGALATVLLAVTVRRNADYGSALGLWRDTVAQAPGNARAHNNLANLLADAGDEAGALRAYTTALALKPGEANTHYNLANLLARQGRLEEAVSHYREALRLAPRAADTHVNLGNTYALLGRTAEARQAFATALQLNPGDAAAHHNLANSYFDEGRFAEAAPHYEAALRELTDPAIRLQLARCLQHAGRIEEARREVALALQSDPDLAEAQQLATELSSRTP